MTKPKVAVSACLIGLKYRYDGGSKMNMDFINALKDRVDFIPVCPEVECGLSIPSADASGSLSRRNAHPRDRDG